MSFRPTDRGVISGPFFGCVQKIRRNITGYRSGFGSAREEELIPALAVISRSSATPRRVSVAMSLLRLRINPTLPPELVLHVADFKHIVSNVC